MKYKKAPDLGNINIELIKVALNILFELLTTIFNKCLHSEHPPEEWKKEGEETTKTIEV